MDRLSIDHPEDLDEDICHAAALEDFANQYPMSSGIFSKSKTIIKPFELFGLLFSFADYKAIHAALLNKAQIIYADEKMKDCIKKFEKSINKQYDPSAVLNPQNMFDKDVDVTEFQKEMAGAKNPKDVQRKMMLKMIEKMMKDRKPQEPDEQKEKLYLNKQLEIDLEAKSDGGVKEIDWSTIYTRENGRILINEVRDAMKICVDALIDERNKNICEMLMNCEGQSVVAFVNFTNIDGIEDKWMSLA